MKNSLIKHASCPLCFPEKEDCIVQLASLRLIFANEAHYPCFVRVVWNAHTREFSDLSPKERSLLMEVVYVVEQCMRNILLPHKINHASFGNRVAHLHWHIIPRWEEDAHWPEPVWGLQQREGFSYKAEKKAALAAAIQSAVLSIVSGDG